MRGRTFLPEEQQESSAHPVIVLSYPFWQRGLNSDPLVLGKSLKMNETAFTIVGVASADFIGTANPPQVPRMTPVNSGRQASLTRRSSIAPNPADEAMTL